jgi:hypothetical protein
MIAALDVSYRVGQLLSLQWYRVRRDLNRIDLEHRRTKARHFRHLPMTQRSPRRTQSRTADAGRRAAIRLEPAAARRHDASNGPGARTQRDRPIGTVAEQTLP